MKKLVLLLFVLYAALVNSQEKNKFGEFVSLDTIISLPSAEFNAGSLGAHDFLIKAVDNELIFINELPVRNIYKGYSINVSNHETETLMLNLADNKIKWDKCRDFFIQNDTFYLTVYKKLLIFKKQSQKHFTFSEEIKTKNTGRFLTGSSDSLLFAYVKKDQSEIKLCHIDRSKNIFGKRKNKLDVIRRKNINVKPSAFGNINPNQYVDYNNKYIFTVSPLDYHFEILDKEQDVIYEEDGPEDNWNKVPDSLRKIFKSQRWSKALRTVDYFYKNHITHINFIEAIDGLVFVMKNEVDSSYNICYDVWKKKEGKYTLLHRDLFLPFKDDHNGKMMVRQNFPLLFWMDGYIGHVIHKGKFYVFRIDSKTLPLDKNFDEWWDIRSKEIIDGKKQVNIYVYDLKL
ncbi:MAG: hypothetical protein K9H84_01670 [Bacteroidales bacterium]|nr:hypothetical protein [Bacteroidales bacterium]